MAQAQGQVQAHPKRPRLSAMSDEQRQVLQELNDLGAKYPATRLSLQDALARGSSLSQWLAENTQAVRELERKEDEDDIAAVPDSDELLLLDGLSCYLAEQDSGWATFSVRKVDDQLSIVATTKAGGQTQLDSRDPVWEIDGQRVQVSHLAMLQEEYAKALSVVSSRVTYHAKGSQWKLSVEDGRLVCHEKDDMPSPLALSYRGHDLCFRQVKFPLKSLTKAREALARLDQGEHLDWDVAAKKPKGQLQQ